MVRLLWQDVAPEARDLDLDWTRHLVEPLTEEALLRGVDGKTLVQRIDDVLIARFGLWLSGWSRGNILADGLPQVSQSDSEPTVHRVMSALVEWQEYLECLDLHFAALGQDSNVESAAARLLPLVVRKTRALGEWYEVLSEALVWYLSFRGLDGELYRGAIDQSVRDSLISGHAPSPDQAAAACRRIGSFVSISSSRTSNGANEA